MQTALKTHQNRVKVYIKLIVNVARFSKFSGLYKIKRHFFFTSTFFLLNANEALATLKEKHKKMVCRCLKNNIVKYFRYKRNSFVYLLSFWIYQKSFSDSYFVIFMFIYLLLI